MTMGEIISVIESADVSMACVDGEIVTAGAVTTEIAQLVRERRQDVAIALMTIRGDYSETNCAHELRVLKAIQGGMTADIAVLEARGVDRLSVERAHQALADVSRLARNYSWLATPENATSPDFIERLRWAGHAALRLITAATKIDEVLRPPARQEALFEAL